MFAYVETAGRSWTSPLGLCMWAAVGDVEIILGIYAAGALAVGDLVWGLRGRWNIYAAAAVLGLADAVLVEYAALAAGHGRTRSACPWCPGLARPVAATSNDTAASTHGLDCPVVGWSRATFAMVSLDQVKKIECWLNGLPRKCLGFKTAAEVFRQNVALTG